MDWVVLEAGINFTGGFCAAAQEAAVRFLPIFFLSALYAAACSGGTVGYAKGEE